jgi:hypothetical protein
MEIEQLTGRVEKLLAEHHPDGYEISFGTSRNLSIEVKEQKIDTFKCSTPVGVSIRVLKSGGMGFSYSSSMDDSACRGWSKMPLSGRPTRRLIPITPFLFPWSTPSSMDYTMKGCHQSPNRKR